MYYEVKITDKDGKVRWETVMDYEYSDQLAYYQEGVRAGWLQSYQFSTPMRDN